MTTSNRITRAGTDRELTTRLAEAHPMSWAQPALLPEPNPRDGWSHRWVRVSTLNEADPSNFSLRQREGWVPVKAEDYPEITLMPSLAHVNFKDNLILGGLILCRMPSEVVQSRDAYMRRTAQAQMEAVNQGVLGASDRRLPLTMESNSNVSFGKG